MKFSTLKETQVSTTTTDAFGGLNHTLRVSDGEFYDMRNMTSDHFPVLSPRRKRGVITFDDNKTHKINGILAKDVLCYVDTVDGETHLYIGNSIVKAELTDSKKTLVNMGAYIIVMPDKKYINSKNIDDYGDIEANYTATSLITYTMCNLDGSSLDNVTVSDTAPTSPANHAYWIDTSATPHVLKQYSTSTSEWTVVATTYVKIASKNIAKDFSQYDGVKISNISESIVQLADLEGQNIVLWDVHRDEDNDGAGDYVVIVGILDQMKQQQSGLKLERKMPAMDFMIESGNRLWGCRYGEDNDGNVVNEIYASKLGDFKNWTSFVGISTDSYSASCGTDGEFTGAISHLGYPLFFKENYLHKVYGSYPANYQIQATECRGVMKGAGRSLAILNEALMYKSRYGICKYDGSLPNEVSQQFGDIQYSAVESGENALYNGAVAGTNGKKYYISMKSEEDNKWYLLVYDSYYDVWHKEDDTRVDGFASVDGEMYFLDHKDNKIKTMLGKKGVEDTSDVDWMVETGIVGTSVKSKNYSTPLPGKKYISQLIVRMSLAIGSRAMFYIQYDSCGEWEHVTTITGTSLKSFLAPIRPKRCDHFKLRIVGSGEAKIYSITKSLEKGSEI